MNLRIGENIRRLRRERNLTQEEMAAHLGISFQSVSKWERCDGYPDITMLPALANYFGVSVDSLIGMDEIAKAGKYDEINRQWTENNRSGLHHENVLLMRDSLKTFPNDVLLLVQLSCSLEKLEGTREEKEKNLRESIALQEQILRYGEDSEVRSATQYNICFAYWKNGERERPWSRQGSCRTCTRPGKTRWCSSRRAKRGRRLQKRRWSLWPGRWRSTCLSWRKRRESPPIWRGRGRYAGSCSGRLAPIALDGRTALCCT